MKYGIKIGNDYYATAPDNIQEARKIVIDGFRMNMRKTGQPGRYTTHVIVGTNSPYEPIGRWKKIGEISLEKDGYSKEGHVYWYPVKGKKSRYVVKRDGTIHDVSKLKKRM